MKRNNVIWGIVLVAIGVIFGTNALGITDISIFFDGWWTLFIIVPCTVGLFTSHDKMGSVIGILIGVALLLACQDVFDFEIMRKLAVPVIVILIGLAMIFKRRDNQATLILEEAKKNGAPLKQCCATFSGQDVDYTDEVFDGAEFNAIFGGIKCDLRNAVIEKDAVINACCIFGGIDILVPNNVNVKVSSSSIFGGISDKNHKNSAENAVTLYINGTCMFGGIDIK
ncbi:MAG: cell wall-active antibiotics response protein [Clostridia bacterium]|nr:cell wall-active antibiotics response protein [Clostridia bacterium]